MKINKDLVFKELNNIKESMMEVNHILEKCLKNVIPIFIIIE